MIRTVFCTLFLSLLPMSPNPASAQVECQPGVIRTTELFKKWRTCMQDRLGIDAHAAVQDLQTEADRLGRAMEGVDALNHFIARHGKVFQDLALKQGGQTSVDLSERLAYQVSWAGTSLNSLSACLAIARVDANMAGETTIAAAATLMRYVRPEMFESIRILEQALRNNDPVDLEGARAIWRSLQAVNSFLEVSQGSFSECENNLRAALVRGTTFVIPSKYFSANEEPATVRLETEAAAMTIGELNLTCDLP